MVEYFVKLFCFDRVVRNCNFVNLWFKFEHVRYKFDGIERTELLFFRAELPIPDKFQIQHVIDEI